MRIWRSASRRQVVRFDRGQFDALQRPVSAARACLDIDPRQGEHPLGSGFGRFRLRFGNSEGSAALCEHRSFASAGEEAEVTDPHESRRQHVQEEPPDELRGGQRHDLDPVTVAPVPILEPDRSVVDRKDTGIGALGSSLRLRLRRGLQQASKYKISNS